MELQTIQQKIYEIRGKQVMLDFDLALLYGVETSQLKRSVRRNIERFEGEDFMFEVTKEELSRCQIGTLNKGRGTNIKYLPFAFTGSSVHGILQARILEVAMPSPRGLTHVFYIYCIGSWILYHSCHLGSSKHIHICLYGHLSLGRLGLSSSLYPSCSIYHLLCTKGMLIGIIMYKELDE